MTKNTKIVFMPVKYDKNVSMPAEILSKIPDKTILFSSIQFLDRLPEIIRQLESHGKKTMTLKSKNFLYEGMITAEGQLLGCNQDVYDTKNLEGEFKEGFDAFLYIGDGVFHPKALLVNNRKDVYCYNPKTTSLEILKKDLHDDIQKRRKGRMLKFLSSKNIGILLTIKPGQSNDKRARALSDKISTKWPEKKVFVFKCNEINFSELENFNFVEIYVNTACPRISHDDDSRSERPIIDIADVEELLRG